tara:strand:- start:1081 stop:1317 length:237 start_codon:yes stop_codon:yes gene_type:complete
MKNLYEKLKPKFRKQLDENVKKYDSVSRIKYTLMSKVLWQELTVSQVSDLITYTNLHSYNMSPYDFLYGDNILDKDES